RWRAPRLPGPGAWRRRSRHAHPAAIRRRFGCALAAGMGCRRTGAGDRAMTALLRALLAISLTLAAIAPAPAANASFPDHGLAELAMNALAEAKAKIEGLSTDLARTPGEL